MRSGRQLAAYLLMGGTINSFTDSELSRTAAWAAANDKTGLLPQVVKEMKNRRISNKYTGPRESQIAAAEAGKFTAVFTRGQDAKAFYDHLVASPEGDHVEHGSVQLNRKGGCQVSWQAAPGAFEDHGRDGTSGIFRYWAVMAETVGCYGSTSGEPLSGTGARTAYLNGRPGQARRVRSSTTTKRFSPHGRLADVRSVAELAKPGTSLADLEEP
jgi:hypothetical protein